MNLSLDRSNWKRVRLGDVVRRSRKQVDPLEAGIERYVAGGHIDGESITIDRWGHPSDGHMGSTFRYVFEPGQILFVSARPYLRKSGVVDFSGVVADKTYVLDAIPDNGLLQEFLPFILASDPFIEYANAQATGSMNPRLLWGPLQGYEFDLPPLDEQKRVADLLWQSERHDGRLRALLTQLESAHVARAAAVLAEVEMTHGRAPLVDLVRELITDGVREKGADVDAGVPYVRVIDMTRPRLMPQGMLRMDADLAGRNRASMMRSGDIVMALRSKIGLCHIVPATLDGCNIAQGVAKVAPDFSKVSTEYLFEVLAAPQTQRELDRVAKGTTIREVGLKALRGFEIPFVADSHQQRDIASSLGAMRAAAVLLKQELVALATLRSSLLSDVFGGN